MKILDIYFDGTKCNLNKPSSKKGKTVVGHAFVANTDAKEVFFDKSDYSIIQNSSKTDPYQDNHWKIYFAGPSAQTSTFQEVKYMTPGKKYNPSKISTAALSQYSTTNKLGIWGDGWEHNLQLALIATINFVSNSLQNNPSEKIAINIPAAFSRGGITGFSFSDLLSNTLEDMGITIDQVSIEQIHGVDPVGGMGYGTLEESIKRPSYKNDLASVSPMRVGSYTKNLTLHIATQEQRKAFKSQLPYGLDTKFKNNRPLFIPDSVKTTIRLSHACHKTIAYPEHLKENIIFPSGCKTFNLITGKHFDTQKKDNPTLRHLGNDSNNLIFPKEDRCVKETTSPKAPEIIQQYSNSVLYDVYRYFENSNNSNDKFQKAFTNPNNKFHDLIVWAYKNSNFYRITKLEPNKFNNDQLSQILLQAVQCKTREKLALIALQYKHYGQCDIAVKTSKLTHEDLEELISSDDKKQKDLLCKTLMLSNNNEYHKNLNNTISLIASNLNDNILSFIKNNPIFCETLSKNYDKIQEINVDNIAGKKFKNSCQKLQTELVQDILKKVSNAKREGKRFNYINEYSYQQLEEQTDMLTVVNDQEKTSLEKKESLNKYKANANQKSSGWAKFGKAILAVFSAGIAFVFGVAIRAVTGTLPLAIGGSSSGNVIAASAPTYFYSRKSKAENMANEVTQKGINAIEIEN